MMWKYFLSKKIEEIYKKTFVCYTLINKIEGGAYRKMITEKTKIVKNKDIEVTDFENEKVMMNLEIGRYFTLNEVGSRIWDLLDKNDDVEGIINGLLEEYEVSREMCSEQVFKYLEELEQYGIIKTL